MMVGKALATWIVMLLLAVTFGAAREALLSPSLGSHRAHQIESLLVCLAFALLSWLFVRWARPTSGQALGIGVLWLVLTLSFEFGFFHLVRGVFAGRLWPLVLLTVLVAPWLQARAGR
jgi:hypothetical protein